MQISMYICMYIYIYIYICVLCVCVYVYIYIYKGKVIPLQARCGSEGEYTYRSTLP